VLKKIFGSRNDRIIRRMSKRVKKINELEVSIQPLNDDQLKAKTDEFRQRLEKGETLDQLLNEAFAVVREASVRALGLRHYDVGDPSRLPECAGWQCARCYRERLPGIARRRVDGHGI